jgi:WD40 repeat protein
VLALEFSASLGKEGLLFSGAADRSIKVWDPWRGSEAEQQLHGGRNDHFCVQTLPAHEASVMCLRLLTQQQRPGLVSCSLDHTIKVWNTVEGRGLLMYPWFVAAQTITMTTTNCWPTSLCIRDAAMSCSLFVGDSEGNVSHYTSGLVLSGDDDGTVSGLKPSVNSAVAGLATRIQFKLKRKHTQFHSLSVLHLQLVCENNFVVSLGFDQRAHVLDAMSGCVSSTITNRNATRFTSCAWDTRSAQWLFLADAMGYVHVWNVFEDKWIKQEKMVPRGTPLLSIHLLASPSSDWLFVGAANMMKQWRIDRDIEYSECSGHSDAIVAFAVLRDEVLVQPNHSPNQTLQLCSAMATASRFFSVSLDNTLRCWDAYDMKVAFGFEERLSEVTCVATSKKYAKIVTGHEAGFLKAWSIHTGQFVVAPLPSKNAVTCLTTGMVRDQEYVFASDVDGTLFVWELNADCVSFTAAVQVAFTGDVFRRDEISAMLFCTGDFISLGGGSEFLVLGNHKGHLAIWSFHKKQVLMAWKAHEDAVSSICRHGCFLLTGSDDTTVRIWNCINLTDPYELGVLRSPGERSSSGSGSAIVAVDIVPDSGGVLCAAADGTITIWDYTDCDDMDCSDYDSYGRLVSRTQYVVA